MYKALSTIELPSRFWVAKPSYDEAQTLFDTGWQSQPTIDHNLYTKYLETGRLTLTRELKPLFITQHDITQDNTYTLCGYSMTHHDTPTHSHHGNLAMLPRTQMALQVMALGGGVAPLFILVHDL